jgi:hypothetical protein
MKKQVLLIILFYVITFSVNAQLNSLGSYVWNGSDTPKIFNNQLQLSFVSKAIGFPEYGSVLAGGGYITSQDGGAFQLYFPYNESYGGNAPKIRLGKYPNQGWSNWETFYTSANANNSTIDWNTKKLTVSDNIITTGKIGIGTIDPKSKLDFGNNYSNPSTFPNKITLWSGGENNYFGFGISSGDLDYFSQGNHRFYTGYNGNPGSEKMVIQANGYVGIGTISPDSKLTVNGKIHTKEVKVDLTGWSDFVFNKEYNLPSLIEVENHIKEKGHLKDIPTAKEVSEKGIYLGKMDAKLLQKIEELTLYTIQQEKELQKQRKINKELVLRLQKIETIINKN